MADSLFFKPFSPVTMGELAELSGASLRNPQLASRVFVRLSSLDAASEGSLTFVDGKKNAAKLANIQAAGVFCSDDVVHMVPSHIAALVTKNPQRAFAAVARKLYPSAVHPDPITGESGIAAGAHIHAEASIEAGATIEDGAVIGKGAEIGSGTLISANAVVGAHCQVGRDSYIGPGATVQNALIGNRVNIHAGVRIGQDGFGYVPGPTGLEKIPQIGRVIIQDDVEIGANTTIDRGALADTVIGEGSKVDNQVQIAHNVRIGRSCVIAAQCGISGSVTIGDMSMLGGRVGLADHLVIGSRVQIAAGSGVMNDIPDGQKWGGLPARPIKQWFREVATLRSIGQPRKEQSSDE